MPDKKDYLTESEIERWIGEPYILIPSCLDCIHKHPAADTCAAFPNGIPQLIKTGQHDHKTLYIGDGGIRYAPKKPLKSPPG